MSKQAHCHCSIPLAGYTTNKKGSGFVSRCQKCGKWPKNTHPNIKREVTTK
jgi:hypothetical protein